MTSSSVLCRNNESFSAHTPLRIGGNADRWIWVYSEKELLFEMLTLKKQRWMLHWPFQDILCRAGGYQGTVIRLAGDFETIAYTDDSITLGSAVLWSQITGPFQKSFAHWSGSVGGIFENQEQDLLNGYTRTLRWLVGKRIKEETIVGREASVYQKKKNILLSVTIRGTPRKRKHVPNQSGFIYSTRSKNSISSIFERYQLTGVRLKGWLVSKAQPSRMLHLGGGTMEELLVLSQGIRERVYKVSGTRIDIRMPIIGKEQKHVE